MPMFDVILLTSIYSIVVVCMLSVNFYLTRKRMTLATKVDAGNLRLVIASELLNLGDLFKDNIDALYAGKDMVASSRHLIAIYRGNLGRLTALAAQELPAIVTAYAASERADALASAHGKAHGHNAFTFAKERPFLADLIASYETAKAAANRALRAMGEVDETLDRDAALVRRLLGRAGASPPP